MTIQEAIRILHPDTTREALLEIGYYAGFKGKEAEIKAMEEACLLACKALKEQDERENPKPLTLEELRQMEGKPVFIQDIELEEYLSDWEMVRGFQYNMDLGQIMLIDDGCYPLCDYGETWLAYRSEPKGE